MLIHFYLVGNRFQVLYLDGSLRGVGAIWRMTTAAKPTYAPARGGTGKSENDLGALSKQYSSRDLPAHTKLKYRSAL